MGALQLPTSCEFQLKMDHLVFEDTSNKTTWAAEADLGEGPGGVSQPRPQGLILGFGGPKPGKRPWERGWGCPP